MVLRTEPASLIMATLKSHIPEEAVSDIQTRQDGSCTFYVHADYADTILRSSGHGNFFVKESKPIREYHLLWLEEEVDLPTALALAVAPQCFGIARKGSAAHPKLAIRFREQKDLAAFAKSHNIRDTSHYGRWKISGIDITVRTYGLLAFLVERGFQDTEVLYLKDSTGVFLSTQPGSLAPSFYMCNGIKKQLMIKALNSTARDQAKVANENRQSSSASSSRSKATTKAEKQQAFFKQVSKPKPMEAVSPSKEQQKRKTDGKTGVTPDAKAVKES